MKVPIDPNKKHFAMTCTGENSHFPVYGNGDLEVDVNNSIASSNLGSGNTSYIPPQSNIDPRNLLMGSLVAKFTVMEVLYATGMFFIKKIKQKTTE